ncbi:MAG: sulfide/dihydroorotate dehydrogenase-like FAD/NAD-binding protein [Candidatus Scatovivens sp.]
MFEILKKKELAKNIILMEIYAPKVTINCNPGQFVIARVDEKGERIPLTICDYDRKNGIVTIVFQIVGATTMKIARLKVGEKLKDFVGPLGNESDFVKNVENLKDKKIIFIAGGVGTAPVYPQVKWLKENGIKSDVIIGAKSKDLIILENEMKKVADNLYVTTDDGSNGNKGLVTDVLKKLIACGKHYDLCVAIGSLIMMKFVCILTKNLNIPTIVSLNPIMIDGTGMCGACRVIVNNEIKFACIDGPEFNGHYVDFDNAINRANMYKDEEKRAKLKLEEGDTHHGGCGFCGGEN